MSLQTALFYVFPSKDISIFQFITSKRNWIVSQGRLDLIYKNVYNVH